MTIQFRPAGPTGRYHVLINGTRVGDVQRRETRYNLRRVYVDRWWQIEDVAGFNDGALYSNGAHHYDTRRAAAVALAEYLARRGQ